MFVNFTMPTKVSAAIHGLKPFKRDKVLKILENKLRLLFTENSHNLYSDIHNYASFDVFLASFMVIDNNGDKLNYFYDEEALDNGVAITEFENNLFEGQIEIKKQDDYIQRSDKLKVDIRIDLEEYLSDGFWKEFDRFS